MKLSIIIPVFKRPELLDYGLYSLSRQKITYPYEIIVLNDGVEDGTENVCKKYIRLCGLPIKYVFTGQRNSKGIKWRTPGTVINQGANIAKGEVIILTSPEVYILDQCLSLMINPVLQNKNILTITQGYDDDKGIFLDYVRRGKGNYTGYMNFKVLSKLNTQLPFFMAMNRQKFLSIGGYDEDFIGFAFDDVDLIKRLKEVGCIYKTLPSRVVHLYHSRKTREGITNEEKLKLWHYNKNLFENGKKVKKIIVPEVKVEVPYEPAIEALTEPISSEWELKKIPKIVHFYWGEEKLPFLRYLSITSFIKYNPDWEVRFYYPKYRTSGRSWKTHEHKYDINITEDYTPMLKDLNIKMSEMDMELLGISNDLSEVHKSDYLRWFLLANIGGLWSDMDIIYIDSMNNISLNTISNENTDATICYHLPWNHSIGFLLSSKDNKYYKSLWDKAKQAKYDPTNYQSAGSLLINRTMKGFKDIQDKFPDLKIRNISMNSVYSYNSFMIRTMFDSKNTSYISRGTIGLHWYAGHPKAGEYVSVINEDNYQEMDNVISEVVGMSLKDTKYKVLKCDKEFNFNKTAKKVKLTIHAVVKNEPFIYYSIKSVYDYADTILLYDTGSNDKHTLKDIKKLLKEDKENKIIFKKVKLDFDESKWTFEKVEEFAEKHKGKMSVGKVRQMQIEDTKTDFCMLVDGDEVHYKDTMEKIVNKILPNLNENIIGVNVPLIWFYDMDRVFRVVGLENTGRIWRTDKVVMNGKSPNEAHCFKDTGKAIAVTDKEYLIYKELTPYAHFETFLKPWRRKIKKKDLSKFKGELPEVMVENPYYINRYIKEKND